MSEIFTQDINPMLFWDRFVVPHKIAADAKPEDKAWPSYIIHNPSAVQAEHPNKFKIFRPLMN